MSLLKTIINTCWNAQGDDKENQMANGNLQVQQPGQFSAQISQQDKEYIKAHIFNCMDMYPSEAHKKIR